MEQHKPRQTAQLLAGAGRGEKAALAGLTAVVYDELRALAGAYLKRERPGHSLQPTALVHEAFLKLVDSDGLAAQDRTHFFAIAATTMRRVLVEHARTRNAAKRGGGKQRVSLSGVADAGADPDIEIEALDGALERLAALDERQARVVELRFFGGLTMDEVAATLGVSKRTAEGDWTMARAWLLRELTSDPAGPGRGP